jgi:metallo-beta-lactamase family protein
MQPQAPKSAEVTTETAHHPLLDGELFLLGAVETVTGSMSRVEIGGARLLIDCGVAQGRDAASWRFPEAASDVDAVLLTHGHNDHVGALPMLFERGFSGPVYGTRPTLEVADLVVSDGLRLQGATDAEVASFRTRLRNAMRMVPYGKACELEIMRGSFTFHDAGHILGSSSIELLSDKSRVICSGDLGRPNSPLLRDYNKTWSNGRTLDLVVVESTYGDRQHEQDHATIQRELERIIKAALEAGGHILVPAFAIGRTQTLLYHLNTLVESGRLPDLPVAVDSPMALRVTELHSRSVELFDSEAREKLAHGDDPLSFRGLYAVERARDSRRLDEVNEPMLIIAGSGMCTGGRIVGHLLEQLPKPETTVLFVGFQAPGTPGRSIQRAAQDGNDYVVLDGQQVPVRARVETLDGLSAHADRDELVSWLEALPGPRRIAINHGEPEAQRALAQLIRDQRL